MSTKPLTILILAAGKGTRMQSSLPQVMHPLAGTSMLNWPIATSETLTHDKIITVIGPDMPALADAVKPHEVIIQDERNGTGGAVKAALPALENASSKVLIVMGDEPLVAAQSLQALIDTNSLSVQGVKTATPHGLGRMVLHDDGSLKDIVEERDCDEQQRLLQLCNAGNYCVPAEQLAQWVNQIGNDNAQGEYYLTDLPAIAAKDGVAAKVVECDWNGAWGINDRTQLAEHEQKLQRILREKAMQNGVTMFDPNSVYVSHDTQIGAGCVIEPNVFFGQGVSIENDVTIRAFSHIEDTQIASGSVIGPFARLRGGSVLSEDVKVGNFVELKNAQLAQGVKASHLSYLGDTSIGASSNIGAGTITCNYNGFEKNQTTIGEGVFVGSNSALVAPITIEDGAMIAAGSTITKNVPKDALAMTRADENTHEGWAARYRKIKAVAKKTILLLALIGLSSTPALACQEFKATLDQLEKAVKQQPKEKLKQPKPLPSK